MKIAVLATRGTSTTILLNWLLDNGHNDLDVIVENNVSALVAFRNRARRLGWPTAIGQILFRICAVPLLSRKARSRTIELLAQHGLSTAFPKLPKVLFVDTVNEPTVARRLAESTPDIVLVNGTRIIRPALLDAVSVPFVNTHVGITPQYRGVHGGYWAIWNNDIENFGVTLHVVDEGVDTGDVIFQARILPSPCDTFATYPILQQAAALPGLALVLDAIASGAPLPTDAGPQGASKQWFHPTLIQYLTARLRGVR